MDMIQMTRELGKEIQKSAEYQALQVAKAANDADETLQNLIGEFNLKRIDMNNEMNRQNSDQAKLEALDQQAKELYGKIMENEHMQAYNEAKMDVDRMMNQISTILMMSVNGADPETCDANPSSCSGSCSDCSGCH